MSLQNITISSLNCIPANGGNVMHGMTKTDTGYTGFGEVYFSLINFKSVKAWKRHSKMTMNLIVPAGNVLFVFFANDKNKFREEKIGTERYKRITVPPNIWFGFKGLFNPYSIVVNIANIPHSSKEVESCSVEKINYNW